jgi:hypothetical protein
MRIPVAYLDNIEAVLLEIFPNGTAAIATRGPEGGHFLIVPISKIVIKNFDAEFPDVRGTRWYGYKHE